MECVLSLNDPISGSRMYLSLAKRYILYYNGIESVMHHIKFIIDNDYFISSVGGIIGGIIAGVIVAVFIYLYYVKTRPDFRIFPTLLIQQDELYINVICISASTWKPVRRFFRDAAIDVRVSGFIVKKRGVGPSPYVDLVLDKDGYLPWFSGYMLLRLIIDDPNFLNKIHKQLKIKNNGFSAQTIVEILEGCQFYLHIVATLTDAVSGSRFAKAKVIKACQVWQTRYDGYSARDWMREAKEIEKALSST